MSRKESKEYKKQYNKGCAKEMKTKQEEKDKRIRNKLRKMKTKLERLDYEVHKIIGVIYNILESLEEKG